MTAIHQSWLQLREREAEMKKKVEEWIKEREVTNSERPADMMVHQYFKRLAFDWYLHSISIQLFLQYL